MNRRLSVFEVSALCVGCGKVVLISSVTGRCPACERADHFAVRSDNPRAKWKRRVDGSFITGLHRCRLEVYPYGHGRWRWCGRRAAMRQMGYPDSKSYLCREEAQRAAESWAVETINA